MPNIKSAMKRSRTIPSKTAINKRAKSELKTLVKKTRSMIETGSEDAAKVLSETQSALQHFACKGHLHKKTAARRMSRLQKALNKQAKA